MNSFVAQVVYSWLEILITCLPIRHSLSKQTRSDFVITGMLLQRFSENQEMCGRSNKKLVSLQITFKENKALKYSEIHSKKSSADFTLLPQQYFEDWEEVRFIFPPP